VRAERVEDAIPLNPFTAGVYIATMMATIEVGKAPLEACMGAELGAMSCAGVPRVLMAGLVSRQSGCSLVQDGLLQVSQ
jgi:hypothetical protein